MLPACPATAASRAADPAPAPLRVGDHRDVELIDAGGPTTAALLDRVAATIGTAVDEVEAFWGTDWPRRIVVLATGTDAQFRAAAGGGSAEQWADVAAVAVADRVDAARRVAAGQRVVLAPGAAAMSPAALHLVLGHELFHYAARRDTALDAPRWLTEGVADFVARPAAPRPGRAAAPLALPTDADLDAPGPQRTLAYDRAWWFARFVADSYGPATLRELYLVACGAGHPDAGTAVRTVLDADLPDLLARWQRWLTG
ncbi:hypothetical protein E2F47_22090 [Mycobacterium eburneum]|nr:hypothetical protein [Mycobacterium eburneum]TDH48947.1 hypothetical protein E2F47_22090 [Mycobacterium eburneum]